MKSKLIMGIVLTVLLIGMLTLAFNVQPVRASYTIYIQSNGSVDPSTAPIQRNGNIYTFTGNIYDCFGIRVQRDNVIIDGNGYTLDGIGQLRGFEPDAKNTTIMNLVIRNFEYGVYLSSGSGYGQTIVGNTIANNELDGIFMYFADNNFICNNTITNNDRHGMYLNQYCEGNLICGNTIENNGGGWSGVVIFQSGSNTFYHNNLIDHVTHYGSGEENINIWDDGYPSGGNYHGNWFGGPDEKSGPNQDILSSDGIIDIGHTMNPTSVDHYPLTKPYGGPHDIGITNVTTSKTVVGQGYRLNVSTKIVNYGVYAETFNVTVYTNTTVIETLLNITLASRNSTIITSAWNTTGTAIGNYIISGIVTPVPSEVYLDDNTFVDGTVTVISPVGGVSIPVNKLELLAPYIGLTMLLAATVTTVVYIKKRKRNREITS